MHPIEASINDAISRPNNLPRGVLRQLKRNARFQRNRAGQHADLMNLNGTAHVRAAAAVAKRERKAQKRLADAMSSEIGQRHATERLNGHLV